MKKEEIPYTICCNYKGGAFCARIDTDGTDIYIIKKEDLPSVEWIAHLGGRDSVRAAAKVLNEVAVLLEEERFSSQEKPDTVMKYIQKKEKGDIINPCEIPCDSAKEVYERLETLSDKGRLKQVAQCSCEFCGEWIGQPVPTISDIKFPVKCPKCGKSVHSFIILYQKA